jgi:hypothetical protein
MLGQEVATPINGELSAGQHDIIFDAGSLPSGTYVYRLQVGHESVSKKMILLR